MRKIRKHFGMVVAATALAMFAAPACAADATDGYVTGFVTIPPGIVFFFQTGTISGTRPSCAIAGLPQRWAIDATTPAGQAILSILMTAKANHDLIKIYGTNACPTSGSSEAPGIIVTNDVQ